jgi:amino-acid N-acetyltransferase
VTPEIRRGASSDLPAVVTLLEAACLPTADLGRIQDLTLWVIEGADSLQGVIALERYGRDALLRSLAVAPDHQTRGLGGKLVARLEEEARAHGIKELVLLTEAAERFFRRIGYEVIDRSLVSDVIRQSAEFRSLCPASAVCMRKTLGA